MVPDLCLADFDETILWRESRQDREVIQTELRGLASQLQDIFSL